tara:strand:- start:468 stop:620 length:153 start_codon:yes stop_codon:yes gene_type:complete
MDNIKGEMIFPNNKPNLNHILLSGDKTYGIVNAIKKKIKLITNISKFIEL